MASKLLSTGKSRKENTRLVSTNILLASIPGLYSHGYVVVVVNNATELQPVLVCSAPVPRLVYLDLAPPNCQLRYLWYELLSQACF